MNPATGELTSENVKSHLQKYRLNSQRSREEFLGHYSEGCKSKQQEYNNSSNSTTSASEIAASSVYDFPLPVKTFALEEGPAMKKRKVLSSVKSSPTPAPTVPPPTSISIHEGEPFFLAPSASAMQQDKDSANFLSMLNKERLSPQQVFSFGLTFSLI